MTNLCFQPLVQKLIALALEEDLQTGDITTQLTIPDHIEGKGNLIAKEPLVVCGLFILTSIIDAAKLPIQVTLDRKDGDELSGKGEIIATLHGKVAHLISIERTILNFLQRLSGVATYTRSVVKKSHGIKILDTRKTMPGWRLLDKYSVTVGGGFNHRFSLGDMILVKNNHIDCAGGIAVMMKKIAKNKPPYIPLEVEVRTLSELREVLTYGTPNIIMLDNMNDEALRETIHFLSSNFPQILIEVSGGITSDRFERLAAAGVTMVSMGALTTRAPNVDISLSVLRST